MVISVYTNHDTPDWKKQSNYRSRESTEAGVEHLRKEHHSWWNHFWKQSHINIGDSYFEKYYYQSQYLFACSSREGKFLRQVSGDHLLRVTKQHGEVIII